MIEGPIACVWKSPVLPFSAFLYVACGAIHADPESVVIIAAIRWHGLMTGLWPVWLLFVWSILPSRISSQLAVLAGPWLCLWFREAAGPGATPGLVPAGVQTPRSSAPLLSFSPHFHSGAGSLPRQHPRLFAPPGSTAPCRYLSP